MLKEEGKTPVAPVTTVDYEDAFSVAEGAEKKRE